MISSTTKKVVTITLNPALDLTGHLNRFQIGNVNLVQKSDIHAAGKGVNVAKVLSELGAEVTVTGFLGKANPELFEQLFQQIGVTDRFIRVNGSTRTNVKLVESNTQVSDINFPSFIVNEHDMAQLEATLIQLCQDHDYFVLAGSLPQGMSSEQCAKWVQLLHNKGKKVIFDSSKEALTAGIDANPWLIKPNDEELSQWMGKTLSTPEECREAATIIAQKGIENIVVSMGAEGVMWLTEGTWLCSQPPKMNVVSTVGAGDTLVAGFCWGHMQKMEKEALLIFATALSALAVTQIGVGIPDQIQLQKIETQIKLHSLNQMVSQ